MLRSFAKRIYDLLTSGPIKRTFKSVASKYPILDQVVRKLQIKLFDLYHTQPRTLRYRSTSEAKQLFVDVSFLLLEDHKTGIQRVVRSILTQLSHSPPDGFRIQPVYADRYLGYRAANLVIAADHSIELTKSQGQEIISIGDGDVFLGLDFACLATLREAPYLAKIRLSGVKVYFVVYDLLPVQFPKYFTPSSRDFHERWLRALSRFDGVVCISKTIASEYQDWLSLNNIPTASNFKIQHFHLGADINNSAPTRGLPDNALDVVARFQKHPTFLMVGTLEPRKGYGLILDAFTELWSKGREFNLVIVGKVGWNIDLFARRLREHPEQGCRLSWFEGVSDEYLELLYSASDCLIAASEGEGFGLPIIEAGQHGIALLVRDIPVFREVAGGYATYFSGCSVLDTAEQIDGWVRGFALSQQIKSDGIQYNTWEQSVSQLKSAILI
jgi:glycosyltransferase involved in cell wall biosynthesis